MKTRLILLLCFIGVSDLLQAQRTKEPVNPVLVRNTPLSNRVNYSRSGRDSLRVELINVNVPGLEIISCEQCTVHAPWYTSGVGTLDVVVKNRGADKSNTATIWVEYGTFVLSAYGGFKKVYVSTRKGVPVLDPGQTTKLTVAIQFRAGDIIMHNMDKGVRVTLTQNGGGAWREN